MHAQEGAPPAHAAGNGAQPYESGKPATSLGVLLQYSVAELQNRWPQLNNVASGGGHPPLLETSNPPPLASHALLYTLPSQAHTGM